ncbi:hypothetical protein AGABI1DRAFT_132015 [Agaricus bisporus var. burnettii JB137-S8]|uniref:Uncharacterized protein n=1 Tax=Agaricus bisporus var. burnettii (strain JB137-S8 / ATCC MYA-4627 / FGSC 10392) TaxID=597362 RepID=K5VMI0_AGABU|nr:uncharacterized protein AGABI1DRAFT_132015 [Agaricus bisporus var. burnettii JB137-S8]EKM75624.1 hypothetical protein AGABI1DRAFT_132015 [Agaricus bisporus var. burnettii JB137-S8]
MAADYSNVKVYTVNGATAGSSSSLPDWLTRKRAASGKGKRAVREQVEGTLELIQGFEFPEASNRVKTTKDGHHVIATGTYKPQIRVWDLDQLSLKFERHSDAENVDFVILSDDWTKSIHLQNDRSVELHTQGGFHYRTRIPRFGRSLAYHFPSCDTYISASGNEIYRLNLDQGRFMTPLTLETADGDTDFAGVNVIDINPAHQLLGFGLDGDGSIQFWDPRSRSSVGTLTLPKQRLLSSMGVNSDGTLSVTAMASRSDGLSYAIGTNTGHTLLYDIRATRPFAFKDQGYGLPIKKLVWIEGGSRMAGDGMVLSTDKKVVKIWDRNSPSTNFVSITPANDLNDIHHVPGSGLLMTANEGIQMATYYIPQLGPAPRWASFLENITEEMEDQSTRSVYEDYKFVERNELKTLGLDHLVGTPLLKPYMHGYFVSLKLYDTARVIANPFAYAEHREKLIREKMDKLAETRIRSKKDAGVKVNKALAQKVLKEAERTQKREDRKKAKKAAAVGPESAEIQDVEMEEGEEAVEQKSTLLSDPRFAKVFEDPAFAIDETSREFALLNPSSVAQSRGKTAVEDEEEESDKASSDVLEGSDSESGSGNDTSSEDSSDAGELQPHLHQGQNTRYPDARKRVPKVNFVPMRAKGNAGDVDRDASFGQRMSSGTNGAKPRRDRTDNTRQGQVGGMEITWTPSASGVEDSGGTSRGGKKSSRKGVESFGAGMERGGVDEAEIHEAEKTGRTQRRKGIRSGSKNVFRSIP